MKLYPVYLKLKNKRCLVVGGGKVAERKIESLMEAEAPVTVVSPKATECIRNLAASGSLRWEQRTFQEEDLEGIFLVIAATDSRDVNREIFQASERRNIPVNAVDEPENCSFYVPARIRRGDLQVAVSTSGKSPYFARKLKEYLESVLYAEIGKDLDKLHDIRTDIIGTKQEETGKKKAMKEALDPEIEKILRRLRTE